MKLINTVSKEKLRGGFYTPEIIADFILKWGVNGKKDSKILEPSCGDGVFLDQIRQNKINYKSITAIEFDKIESQKSDKIKLPHKKVFHQDFHLFCNQTDERFDLIVGNPPYIRFQYFNKKQQLEASKIFSKANLKYSKLTNAWVSFVIGSSLLLKEKGKIGFVLPAEILQVSYAETLRKFLAIFYNKINIVSFEKLVFPDIQQEVVLLLCEKDKTNGHSINHTEVRDAEELVNIDLSVFRKPSKKIDFEKNKWTFYFLNQTEVDFLENIAKRKLLPKIGDYSKVEVGITTGANEYFSPSLPTVKKYNLEKYAKPLVGRSVQVSSLNFSHEDWVKNRDLEVKAHILLFPTMDKLSKNNGALKYINEGIKKGIHKGYKCGIRNEWQIVPSAWTSDLLFIRRSNLYPKLVINEANAYTTDTMHRVELNEKIDKNAFVASYYNSLSLAFAEISGRSYGGGVLELMPSEVGHILLPYKKSNAKLMKTIDRMMRDKKSIAEILKITDKEILKKGFGFSDKEIAIANNIWKKLSSRRLNRKHNS